MRSILLTCLLAACASEPTSEPAAAEPTGAEDPAPQPTPPSSDSSAAEPPADAVLRARAIRVEGSEVPVWLGPDGVLHVGALTHPIDEFTPPSEMYEGFWRQASLSVVTFDPGREAIVLALPTPEEEDPPNFYWVGLVRDGALQPIFMEEVGVYGVQPILLPGDGTVRYVEDGWTACERLEHPAEATRQEVVHRWDPATETLGVERTDTELVQRCDQLAACPFVYVVDGSDETFVGEVLRDVRGRENATLQPLAIGTRSAGTVHVRLREEKQEVTFLDELYAEIDGVRIEATECIDAGGAHCIADGRPLIMRPGDELDVTFEVPSAGELTIWARGYYVPTPTAATR